MISRFDNIGWTPESPESSCWTIGEPGPNCPCGNKTAVGILEYYGESSYYLICVNHNNTDRRVCFPLPDGKPARWGKQMKDDDIRQMIKDTGRDVLEVKRMNEG